MFFLCVRPVLEEAEPAGARGGGGEAGAEAALHAQARLQGRVQGHPAPRRAQGTPPPRTIQYYHSTRTELALL